MSMSKIGPYQKILVSEKQPCRKIAYSLCEASNPSHRNVAIVLFYPLSASSLIVDTAAESGSIDGYRASVICIDRSSTATQQVGKADHLPHDISSIERMEGHADDVLAVLSHHDIDTVYLLGICIGHPYAVCVARRLLRVDTMQLRGLALLAPFVSPACPAAWRVARLGASVPSPILRVATSSLTWIGSASMPVFLTPKQLKKLISAAEQREFGWKEEDFQRAVDIALKMHSSSSSEVQAIEARVGADPSWQALCDEFGAELLEQNQKGSNILCVIHACREDKISPLASIEWIARRCYGGEGVVSVNDRVHSHELMTMFGGPPGDPVLLHQIVKEWGLF